MYKISLHDNAFDEMAEHLDELENNPSGQVARDLNTKMFGVELESDMSRPVRMSVQTTKDAMRMILDIRCLPPLERAQSGTEDTPAELALGEQRVFAALRQEQEKLQKGLSVALMAEVMMLSRQTTLVSEMALERHMRALTYMVLPDDMDTNFHRDTKEMLRLITSKPGYDNVKAHLCSGPIDEKDRLAFLEENQEYTDKVGQALKLLVRD